MVDPRAGSLAISSMLGPMMIGRAGGFGLPLGPRCGEVSSVVLIIRALLLPVDIIGIDREFVGGRGGGRRSTAWGAGPNMVLRGRAAASS